MAYPLKTVLLTAAAAALVIPGTASAQSSIQLGGRVKLGVDNVRYSGGTAPTTQATRVTDNSSNWYFKGTEDLGGGNQAFFHLETTLQGDTGAIGAPRFFAVGLGNRDWGRVLMGVWSIYFASDSALSPASISDGQPYAAGTLNVLGAIGKRGQYFAGGFLPNTLRYESPRWGGFAFTAAYLFDTETAGQSSNRSLNFNPTYINGPLTLYANILQRNNQPRAAGNFSTTFDQKAVRLGAGYQLAEGLKAAILWDRNTVDGSAVSGGKMSRDAWAIPVSYRTGPHLFTGAYGQARSLERGGIKANDTGAQMLAVGYEYFLSKRTSLAANYSTVKNQSGAAYDFWHPNDVLPVGATNTGFTSRYIYAGIKHTF